jgi:hypothetical protein
MYQRLGYPISFAIVSAMNHGEAANNNNSCWHAWQFDAKRERNYYEDGGVAGSIRIHQSLQVSSANGVADKATRRRCLILAGVMPTCCLYIDARAGLFNHSSAKYLPR